jgi:hypothetical protein
MYEKKMYYIEKFDYLESVKLVRRMFLDIINSKYHDYTYFVHNLSGFDYIFILNALTYDDEDNNKFLIKPIIKDDNTLVSLKISKNVKYKKEVNKDNNIKEKVELRSITLLDSNLFLNYPLRKLAKEFSCEFEKGYFPYKFINKNTLFYIGKVPNLNYFTDLSSEEYNELFKDDFIYDVRNETLKYLNNDLLSLLEIMIKFANIIYDEFGINITESKTISGLSMNIYLSNFYDKIFKIKEIKGEIENEIRKAYFGGIVVLNKKGKLINNGNNAYYYDFNSFYPSLMLKDMPVGNPILSSSKELDSYFGFCYAEIIPPVGLDNYLIPYRDKDGNVYFPSEKFSGIYFSELLKASRYYGYKINVLGGFKFEKGIDIFSSFVNNLYKSRMEAKIKGETSLQYTFKLILNSLYGRFGMKQIENKIEIVDKKDAEILLKKKNVSLYSEMNNKCLIKYNNNISYNLIKLVSHINEKENTNTKNDYLANIFKQRGIPSSVAISAAITAYGHIELMKFKNDKSNKLLYSDTDSVIMEKKIEDNNLLSETELGKLKLEHVITDGYFIAPKFYGFKNEKGEIVIKSKGVRKGILYYEDLARLSKGECIKVYNTVFLKKLNSGTVKIIEQEYYINGID